MDAPLSKLALWIMNMEVKFNIPYSTVQSIFEELTKIPNVYANVVADRMIKLVAHNIDPKTTDQVLECLRSNPLSIILSEDGVLRTEHSRKTFFRDNFNYVEPVALSPESSNDMQRTCNYIPILESLKAL